MNPCTSPLLTPTHNNNSRGAGAHPPSPPPHSKLALESHGLQLLEMGTKEQDYDELRDLLQSWDVADLLPHLQGKLSNEPVMKTLTKVESSTLRRRSFVKLRSIKLTLPDKGFCHFLDNFAALKRITFLLFLFIFLMYVCK